MGTRNLTKVIDKDGIVRVAQYGQWDGYPSGQGLTALYHAHNAQMILANLGNCHFLSESEIQGINDTFDRSRPLVEQYPTLSRDTCADILGYVAYGIGQIPLVDESSFEKDELFCEGVYTIDFSQNKFISWYADKWVEFDLENLPDKETYLASWEQGLGSTPWGSGSCWGSIIYLR